MSLLKSGFGKWTNNRNARGAVNNYLTFFITDSFKNYQARTVTNKPGYRNLGYWFRGLVKIRPITTLEHGYFYFSNILEILLILLSGNLWESLQSQLQQTLDFSGVKIKVFRTPSLLGYDLVWRTRMLFLVACLATQTQNHFLELLLTFLYVLVLKPNSFEYNGFH